MAQNILKKAEGVATIAGSVVYTVPANKAIILFGCRVSNKSDLIQYVHIKVNNTFVTGKETMIPINTALDVVLDSKIVAVAGDVITAFSTADGGLDVYLSFTEQG